jgi:hypothetical protein
MAEHETTRALENFGIRTEILALMLIIAAALSACGAAATRPDRSTMNATATQRDHKGPVATTVGAESGSGFYFD